MRFQRSSNSFLIVYTIQECINRLIYFVLRCRYFYNPVAFLLLFQFSFLIPKNVQHTAYIHQWMLVKNKAIISEVFWRKFYDFPTLGWKEKCTSGPKEGGIRPLPFMVSARYFNLVCVYVYVFSDPSRHPSEIVNHIIVLLWHLYLVPVKIKWWDDNRTPFWDVENKSLRMEIETFKTFILFSLLVYEGFQVRSFQKYRNTER